MKAIIKKTILSIQGKFNSHTEVSKTESTHGELNRRSINIQYHGIGWNRGW